MLDEDTFVKEIASSLSRASMMVEAPAPTIEMEDVTLEELTLNARYVPPAKFTVSPERKNCGISKVEVASTPPEPA